MREICLKFQISDIEFKQLEVKYSKLLWHAAHELKRKNSRNNYTDDPEDIYQELVMALMRAGSYYKRQCYIEKCLVSSIEHTGFPEAIEFLKEIIKASKPDSHMRHLATQASNRMMIRPPRQNNNFLLCILKELALLWENRTRHGANRQKFGPFQEQILNRIVRRIVPKQLRPSVEDPLTLDSHFATYCKSIVWNGMKSMGKRITREKAIRSGQVSLSEFDYLGSI